MSDLQNNEVIKVSIRFDNGKVYEVDTLGSNTKCIMSFNTNDSEALLAGNPIGVISSNSADFSIYDFYGSLNINNKGSEYYGYMRNGAEVVVEISDDGIVYKPYGTYYVDSWTTDISDLSGRTSSISGLDRLQYIGNQEIPKLPAYSGIPVDILLKSVFNGLGLEDDEFYIDESLNKNLLFGVTKGAKVRDFLNTVSQALLARVTIGKDNKVRVVPATSVSGTVWTLDDVDIQNISFRHNESNIYNKVRVNYINPGDGSKDIMVQLSGLILKPGENEFKNLEFNSKAIDVEQVYIETPDTVEGSLVNIGSIKWTAYQSGIDVSILNNSGIEVKNCLLVVMGRVVLDVGASEMSDIQGADTKIANILDVDNYIIQDSGSAVELANKLSEYLSITNKIIDIDSALTPLAECGDSLSIVSDSLELNGEYKIIECNTTFGLGQYNKQVSLVKIGGNE